MWSVIVVVDDPAGERRPSMVEVAEEGEVRVLIGEHLSIFVVA